MNETVCVLSYRPYKYSAISRRITTYYQLIPADVFYLSPFPTTQYHPSDKLPRSLQFKTSKRDYNALGAIFSFFFKFLEFYTVFYHLFRNSPTIVHLIAGEIQQPTLLAVEMYCFYKKCKLVLHLDKKPDGKEVEVLESFITQAELDRTILLTSDISYLAETGIKPSLFTEVNGFLHFDQPMINRVRMLTSALFAQPEQTVMGVRTLFEYFENRGDGMIYGNKNPRAPTLIGIPCTKRTDFDAVEKFLMTLETTAQGKQFVVVLTQEPSRKDEQLKSISQIIKRSKNYYAPKVVSSNKFLKEKKPLENIFISRMMFTDMDFDLFLVLCDAVVAFDQRSLKDLLCLRRLVISYNCESERENVVKVSTPEELAECVLEIANIDLKPNTDYPVFEDILKEKIGYEVVKDLAFEEPEAESGCGGGCGGCGGGCGKEGGHGDCEGGCDGCDKHDNCNDCHDNHHDAGADNENKDERENLD